MIVSPVENARSATLERLARESFDVLVIGGGITGAGVARDAALRGLKVALVEKSDFASGTSSKSSKLVHGGLRYLEHAQFRLVFEGTHERALLMRVAPHLVKPIEFLVPSYKGDKPGLFVLDVGLWIYDALSLFSSPRLHRTLRAGPVAKLEPGLKRDALVGGFLYFDCQTDDARLTLENILDARTLGAAILNHTRALELLRDGDRITGAAVAGKDGPVRVRARVVVNATGPWCDEIRELAGETPILHTSKGVHIVVDSARLPTRHTVVMKQDKRVVFTIPWGDRTVVGTTDTFYEGRPDDVHADRQDVEYLLALANEYFPAAKLVPEDVLATWAGLRPLIRPQAEVPSASDVSREHHILSRPGLVTIAGGKLTTFRRMAAEVVEHAGQQLGSIARSRTEERPLPGAEGLRDQAQVSALAGELAAAGVPGVDAAVATLLANSYGVRARGILARIREEPALGARLDAELPCVLAQVDVAVEEELAYTVDDVLGRRVPLLLRARDQGLSAASKVAARMGLRLGWDEARVALETERYRQVVAETRRFR